MNQRIKLILDEAQKLDPVEREELAELLMVSLSAEHDLTAAWLAEAEQRWNAHLAAGTADADDAFDAVERARRSLKR